MVSPTLDKPFVRVVWLDASDPQGDESWFRESEALKFGEELMEVSSFGYLISKTAKYVTLVADHITKGTKETTYGRLTKIPVGMVVSITDITLPPE